MLKYAKRESFAERLDKADEATKRYYSELEKEFRFLDNVKPRVSLRCVTFRHNNDIIGKIALGGRSLKLFLAMEPDAEMLKTEKIHARDLSKTKAYELVPTMIPIQSELAVRKAKKAIQYVVVKKVYNFNV